MPTDTTRDRRIEPAAPPRARPSRLRGLESLPPANRIAAIAAKVPEPRPVGRPRSGTADRALLDVALAILA